MFFLSKHSWGYGDTSSFVAFEIRQLAWDCKKSIEVSRVQSVNVYRNGKLIDSKKPEEWEKDRTSSNGKPNPVALAAQSKCPTKAGYQRFGKMQVDVSGAMRSNELVNAKVLDNKGDTFTITINCKKMLIGIESEADTPISPGSTGSLLYKALCN